MAYQPPDIGYQNAKGSYLEVSQCIILLLTSTIPLGLLSRQIKNNQQRETFMAIIGGIFLVITTGFEVLYLVLNAGIVLLLNYHFNTIERPRIIFITCFVYRTIFSLSPHLGLGLPSVEYTFTNTVNLVLVIKLISVTYEIRDFRRRKSSGTNNHNHTVRKGRDLGKTWPLEYEPSTWEVTCYLLNFSTLATGPFTTFRTYNDCIHSDLIKLPYKKKMIKKILEVAFYFALSKFFKYHFSLDHMRSNDFYEAGYSFAYSYFYPWGVVVAIWTDFSIAWLLAETGCIASGMGLYPTYLEPRPGQGPSVVYNGEKIKVDDISSEDEVSSLTVHNIDPYTAFFCLTTREFFRKWNSCVQWWLGNYVYHADSFAKLPRTVRAYFVMIVSAIWHGYQPGYYFAFLCVPLLFYAEDSMNKTIRTRLPEGLLTTAFDLFMWIFYKMLGIGYILIPFKLRTWNEILRYLSYTYYFKYVLCVSIILVCMCIEFTFPKEEVKKKDN